ncbi:MULTISPECIES: helix-turn-helix transcriptional regulator [unclassified Geodermatophilus]|uniref:helix-turn-helix transcriptional regulator n=1 Tax=unclassified Geodermatophilus TaxID=2637632 RepID=UPI003EEE84DF
MKRTEVRPAATLPPVTLTPEEAAAIAAALAAQPDGPYAEAGRGALEKVLGALEPDAGRRARLLATSLWVSAEASHATELRALVEQAVAQRRVLVLRYRDGKGNASRRTVEPQLLVRSNDHWFLVAWCRERQAPRWFREDRIEQVQLTAETAQRRDLSGLGVPPSSAHPAGRALHRRPPAPDPVLSAVPEGSDRPRLVALPGGRS